MTQHTAASLPPIQPGHFLPVRKPSSPQGSPARRPPPATSSAEAQPRRITTLSPRPVPSRKGSVSAGTRTSRTVIDQTAASVANNVSSSSPTGLHKVEKQNVDNARDKDQNELPPTNSTLGSQNDREPLSSNSSNVLHRSSSTATLRGNVHPAPISQPTPSTSSHTTSSIDTHQGLESSSSHYHTAAAPSISSAGEQETASEGSPSLWAPGHRKSTSLGTSIDMMSMQSRHRLDARSGTMVSPKPTLPDLSSSPRTSVEGSTTVESVQSLTPEWGSHFWVVIEDPKTHHLLFYNPSMGECRWTVPKGTFVLPRDPERDWLEFLDETTSLPYYWHAHSRTAQWERPSAARLIIPLMALQKLTASNVPLSPSNLSQLRSRSSTGTLPSLHQRRNRPALSVAPQLTRTRSNVDISETHSHHINQASNPASDASITTPGRRRSSTATGSVLLKRKVDASSNGTRTANPSVYPGSTEPTRHPTESHIPTEDSGVVLLSETASWKGKGDIPTSDSRLTFSSSLRKISEHADGSSLTLQEDAKLNAMSKATRKDKRMIGLKVAPVAALLGIPRPPTGSAMSKANKGPRASSDRPPSFDTMTASSSAHEKMAMPYRRPRDPEKRFKAANIPAHSVSVRPHDSNSSISVHTSDKSQREKETSPSQHMDPFELYATENYHRRRKGLFKRKIDPPEPLRWQHNHLASPLLSLPRDLHRDAILSSKIVLRICGEREKPVFFGKPPLISVGFTPHDHSSSNRGGDLLPMSVKALRCGNTRIRSDKTQSSASSGTQGAASTWQEQRWVIETCICKSLLRDEVFCQVISRLSKAAPPTSRFRAWQFLGVLLASLCPTSSELCASLCTFIDETCSDTKEHGSLLTLARHCQSRLFAIMQRGPSVVAPSVEEIQGSWEAAFNPSIFGQTLEQVMKAQSLSFPDLQVPVILPFLGEALSKLNPPPGMFRSGGNVHKQIDLRLRIDRGQYTLKGIVEDQRDVLVVGSVLKTFLRELAEPLIPQSAYEACIDAAARESIPGCTALLASKSPIPALNRRSLLYLIALLQRFSRPEIVKVTGVDAVSLASIFSPTIFRGPSTDVAVISHNARFESKWLHAQILHLPCDNVDPDYVPTIPQSSRSFPSSLHLQRSDSKQHSYRGVAYSVAHRYEDLRRPPRPNMTPQTRSSGR